MTVVLPLALGVVRDFEAFGGASPELVAWELGVEPAVVNEAWQRAVDEDLVGLAGRDDVLGEQMWRLTDRGRAMLETPRQPGPG